MNFVYQDQDLFPVEFGLPGETFEWPFLAGALLFAIVAVLVKDKDQRVGLVILAIGFGVMFSFFWWDDYKQRSVNYARLVVSEAHVTLDYLDPTVQSRQIPFKEIQDAKYRLGGNKSQVCQIELILKSGEELNSVSFFHRGSRNCVRIRQRLAHVS